MNQPLKEDLDFLQHYGTKGMRWGVRNEDKGSGRDSGSGEEKTSARTRLGEHNLRVNTQRQGMLRARAAKTDIYISELQAEIATLPKYSYNKQILKSQVLESTKLRDKDLAKAEKEPTTGLTVTQKRVLIGAGVAAAVIGVAVVSKYYDHERLVAGLERMQSMREHGTPFATNGEYARASTPQDVLSKVVKGINPNYNTQGGAMNCRRATFAYELRRRGYDVQATTSGIGYGQNETGLVNALIKGDRNLISPASMSSFSAYNSSSELGIRTRGIANDARKYTAYTEKVDNISNLRAALSKMPNGARGESVFDMGPFAHSMQWEIFDGVPHIFDSQKASHFETTTEGLGKLTSKWGVPKRIDITRLDDVDLDLNFLGRWARNTGTESAAETRRNAREVQNNLDIEAAWARMFGDAA